MTDKAQPAVSGELINDDPDLTLEELCAACSVSSEVITTYVSEGIIQPQQAGGEHWIFSQTSIIKVRRATRLETDLRLNAAGVALALELVAEIETLKQRLARHERDDQDRLRQS